MAGLPDVYYSANNKTDPAKVTLTFRGTCNCDFGNRFDCGPPKSEPINWEYEKPSKYKPKTKEEEEAERKKIHMTRRRNEFDEKGIAISLYGTVERKVKCAAMCTDHILHEKRNRLREMLLSEEKNYAEEFISLCQLATEKREEELERQAFDLKTRLERERKELVEKKLQEAMVINCDEARPILCQKNLRQIKQDQLWQIQEKCAIQEMKREEERMYHDLMVKDMMALQQCEEENAKVLWQKQQDNKQSFLDQKVWKQKKEELENERKIIEKKQLDEAIKASQEKEQKEFEEKQRKNQKALAEYQEFIEREKKIREKRRKDEIEVDATFYKLAEIELNKERNKAQADKERMKREMAAFRESLEEMKRQRELEDREVNELIDQLNEKRKKEKDEDKARLREARDELFRNVMKGRDEQIRQRKEREKHEKAAEVREIELFNLQSDQHRRIREEYEKKRLQEKQEYARQLQEQIQRNEEAKRRVKEEKAAYLQAIKDEEERKIREVEEILKLDLEKPHPMKKIIAFKGPTFVCPYPCPK